MPRIPKKTVRRRKRGVSTRTTVSIDWIKCSSSHFAMPSGMCACRALAPEQEGFETNRNPIPRYARAFEVGQSPYSVKYDLAVNLKTSKAGAVIKSRIRLPHPVRSDRRIGVICKEGSAVAIQAMAAGAVAVGEETMFDIIRSGSIAFTSVICDQSSADTLAKQKDLGRILGPKGIMPSVRQRTITTDVLGLLREMAGADNYREKDGVVRIAIAQLGFSPEMVAANVKAFVAKLKEDCQALEYQTRKDLHEIVLSTTHGPGFSLNGGFMPTEEGITPAKLKGPM